MFRKIIATAKFAAFLAAAAAILSASTPPLNCANNHDDDVGRQHSTAGEKNNASPRSIEQLLHHVLDTNTIKAANKIKPRKSSTGHFETCPNIVVANNHTFNYTALASLPFDNAFSGAERQQNLSAAPNNITSRHFHLLEKLPAKHITPDFKHWLNQNSYGQYDFATFGCHAEGDSFGGHRHGHIHTATTSSADANAGNFTAAAPNEANATTTAAVTTEMQEERRPVVFVHGAKGHALSWRSSLRLFLDNGYKMSQLYALSWGNGLTRPPGNQPVYIERINKFLQAVLNYTGAPQIDVVAASTGVTLARAAIAGIGENLPRLSSRVRNFISIAGLNRGVKNCTKIFAEAGQFCDAALGFDPKSQFLSEINEEKNIRVADNIYSVWSDADEKVPCAPYNSKNASSTTTSDHDKVRELVVAATCLVPGQKCDVLVPGLHHGDITQMTAAVQLSLLRTEECQKTSNTIQ